MQTVREERCRSLPGVPQGPFSQVGLMKGGEEKGREMPRNLQGFTCPSLYGHLLILTLHATGEATGTTVFMAVLEGEDLAPWETPSEVLYAAGMSGPGAERPGV